jgi:hypothetical protein
MARREAALRAAGIPECAWSVSHAKVDVDSMSDEQLSAWASQIEDHQLACELCRRREDYLLERFGPAPSPPLPQGFRLLTPVFHLQRVLSRIPSKGKARLRPQLVAGIGLLSALVGLLPRHGAWLVLLYPLSLAAAGFVGFPIFRFLAEPKQGRLVRWLVVCMACVGAAWAFGAVYLLSGYTSILDTEGQALTWIDWSVIGAIMGLAFGTLGSLVGLGGGA